MEASEGVSFTFCVTVKKKKKKGRGTMSAFCFLEESMYVFYRASVDFLTLSRLLIDFSFFFFLIEVE